MADLEAKIGAAEQDFEAAGKSIEEALQTGQEGEVEYWREERSHLRKTLQQLREKELLALKRQGQSSFTDGRSPHAEFTEFWQALPNAVFDDRSRLLHLRSGFLPLFRGDNLYVRECYEQLTEMALEMTPVPPLSGTPSAPDSATDHQLLVTGTPGVGKTVWQLHLLWELARREATVVLDWADSDSRFLLTKAGCFEGDKRAFRCELSSPETWFLVDSQLPRRVTALTVETCSPDHAKTWEFRKRGARRRVMPVWSLSELEGALPLFPMINMPMLHHLFSMWGGSIRWCLTNGSDPHNAAALSEGIDRTDLSALRAAVSKGATVDKVSDRTLHIIADKDLRWSHFTFASQYVADQIVDRLLEGARRELELFLSSSRGRPELAQIRACLFESFVHHVLPLGGVFEQRDLDTGTPLKDLLIDPRNVYKVEGRGDVEKQLDGLHCLPESEIHESMDFMCQPDKAQGLRKACAVLRGPKAGGQAWLTFIVPPDKFDNFKIQKMRDHPGLKKHNFRQRVLKMPLTPSAACTRPNAGWRLI